MDEVVGSVAAAVHVDDIGDRIAPHRSKPGPRETTEGPLEIAVRVVEQAGERGIVVVGVGRQARTSSAVSLSGDFLNRLAMAAMALT